MRSVSAQMSCVSARSSSLRPGSSSWAAPRMPDSGFLISCASTAAMPDTERAAARWVSWRSIICAIERCCSISTIRPGWSGMAPREHVDQAVRAARAAAPTSTPYSLTVAPERRTWPTSAPSGLREGDDVGQRLALEHAVAEREERLGRRVGIEHAVVVAEHQDRVRQRREQQVVLDVAARAGARCARVPSRRSCGKLLGGSA